MDRVHICPEPLRAFLAWCPPPGDELLLVASSMALVAAEIGREKGEVLRDSVGVRPEHATNGRPTGVLSRPERCICYYILHSVFLKISF